MSNYLTRTFLILLACLMLNGCATIVSGTTQSVNVNTDSPADCTVENNKGSWRVNAPGAVTVKKASSGLKLTCKRPGRKPVTHQVDSDLEPWVFGNLLSFGLVGGAIDFIDGAAWQYPKNVNVPLK